MSVLQEVDDAIDALRTNHFELAYARESIECAMEKANKIAARVQEQEEALFVLLAEHPEYGREVALGLRYIRVTVERRHTWRNEESAKARETYFAAMDERMNAEDATA